MIPPFCSRNYNYNTCLSRYSAEWIPFFGKEEHSRDEQRYKRLDNEEPRNCRSQGLSHSENEPAKQREKRPCPSEEAKIQPCRTHCIKMIAVPYEGYRTEQAKPSEPLGVIAVNKNTRDHEVDKGKHRNQRCRSRQSKSMKLPCRNKNKHANGKVKNPNFLSPCLAQYGHAVTEEHETHKQQNVAQQCFNWNHSSPYLLMLFVFLWNFHLPHG